MNKTPGITGIGMKGKNMKTKLTPEQKKLQREYNRMQLVVNSASRGQQLMRPQTLPDGTRGYSEQQHEHYAKYQGYIDRANTRMAEIRQHVVEHYPEMVNEWLKSI